MVKVTVEGLIKKFGEVVAVDDASFEAKERCFLTLLGPSGCGKTTILRCIAGLEVPDAGRICFDSIEVTLGRNIVPPERRQVGMVFQSYAVWPHMTVFDNIAFPLKIRKMSSSEIKNRVAKILDVVKLSGLEHRYATQLSGGQQQRVALARALVYDPNVLLLDEPLSNLDAKLRESMRLELKEIQKSLGITTIYVTHDQLEAMVLSDTIVVLDKGKVQQIGTPKELYERPANKFVAEFVGSSNLIEGKIVELQKAENLAVVDTPIGLITCYNVWNLSEGSRVLIAIRPEYIEVAAISEEGYRARVIRSAFMGEAIIYWLDISGLTLCFKTRPSIILPDGKEVCLKLKPEYCKMVKL